MGQLRVRNWDKWQSYRRDRGQPPFIKVHRRILMDPDFILLPDATRGHLFAIWVVAAERNGVIPDDPKVLQRLINSEEEPNIELLLSSQFLEKPRNKRRQRDAKMTPERRQNDAPETETETDKNKQKTDAVFRHWQSVMEHPKAALDEKRRKLIRNALQSYSVEQLCQAIDGCHADPWHMGQNDRGKRYDSLGLILRDADHIDQFCALAEKVTPITQRLPMVEP